MKKFNIYCDESCHLEFDDIPVMVLGAITCPQNISGKIARDIRAIQKKHGLSNDFEIKWTKVSQSKQDFYKEVVDYFFQNNELMFRAVVVPDKTKLNHQQFSQTHNDFYYKMYFYLLRNLLTVNDYYYIYLDIKDTQGEQRIQKLKKVLHNAHYDFNREIVQKIQHIRSHEVKQIQLTDLFIGALTYKHRNLSSNLGKVEVIKRIQYHTNLQLTNNTLPNERKFNLFIWEAR